MTYNEMDFVITTGQALWPYWKQTAGGHKMVVTAWLISLTGFSFVQVMDAMLVHFAIDKAGRIPTPGSIAEVIRIADGNLSGAGKYWIETFYKGSDFDATNKVAVDPQDAGSH